VSTENLREDSGINPLGFGPVGAVVVLILVGIIWAIAKSGNTVPTQSEATATDTEKAVDADQLRAAAQATVAPTPMAMPTYRMIDPQPIPTPAPSQPRQPSALEEWRHQKQMKAQEAPIRVAAFEANHNTKEIPSHDAAGDEHSQGKDTANSVHPPALPYTVMEGGHLEAVLISGIDSDIPGPILAQVERPVYDTATGCYLLIPQGSRLVGGFEQPEGFQDRVQVGWSRLIFPDTSSIDLPKLPATDPQGYAGATDKVNSHYLATFGTAALTSLLSVGSAVGSIGAFNGGQVSPYTGAYYQPNPQQQLEQQALQNGANSMAQTGSMFMQRGMNRPKTITIRPGYRFDVFITQDLVLPGPYKEQR
jgi:type IV secretory pathway VirB10-like protein